ncbi:uncharacterized protein LOC117647179 [Thrips palmi]|uniref:Uncharacterized protein LOC117647179 n=1 Tax=Thrips palmi TaxID=161013 RepID=A0A6P8ZB31_THRPL|nr:uncharacterized protein LOC117647179 [Thrips palmi]
MATAKKRRAGAGKTSAQQPTSSASFEALPLLSPSQLRDLWDFDNQCGFDIMGAPLRRCSCRENDENTEGCDAISSDELDTLKVSIKEMWNNAKSIFEIFYDPNASHLGYRMRVKKDMPINVTLRMEDSFFFGWCASAPETGPCSHLYARSPVQPRGYMGGPASFCNWAPSTATISLIRPSNFNSCFFVRLECKNLSNGTELVWNYGCPKRQPVDSNWFKQCCVSIESKVFRRHEKRDKICDFMHAEKCVLCGLPFSTKNKERRIQRKPHFVNSHADYLGSTWNGLGYFKNEEVTSAQVLTNAHLLNGLLQSLTRDLKWTIVPACIVMNRDKDAFADSESLLQEFKKRCELLKELGILVLRGMEEALSIENLSVEHLQPIPKSVWRTLQWKDGVMPVQGIYSARSEGNSSSSDHDAALRILISKVFSKTNLKQPDEESS